MGDQTEAGIHFDGNQSICNLLRKCKGLWKEATLQINSSLINGLGSLLTVN